MGFKIFDEEETKPRNKYADDFVGRFRSGAAINGRPVALKEWRVTTGDPDVAEIIADALGGEPQEWDATGEDNIEVYTETQTLNVIVESVRSEMILWGRAGAIRKCDGVSQLYEDEGKPCECPSSLPDRKAAAQAGKGCGPSVTVVFRLADNPDLGKFRFVSGSWNFAKDIGQVEAKIEALAAKEDMSFIPVKAVLGLEVVEYTTKTGEARKFTKPTLTVKGKA